MSTVTICTGRGCRTLTDGYLCEQCHSEREQAKSKHRGTATSRGYTYKWSQASKQWRDNHPLCRQCLALGRTTAAECTDHILPTRFAPHLFWIKANWQSLCHSCHSLKTSQEAGISEWQPQAGRYVVTGPICGGKSTYVQSKAQPGDVVWDMDLESQAMGWASHKARTTEQLKRLRAMRAQLVHKLSVTDQPCWVIVHNPWLACKVASELRAKVELISCDEEIRVRRIRERASSLGYSGGIENENWGLSPVESK